MGAPRALARLEIVDEDGSQRTVLLQEQGATLGRATDNSVAFPRCERISRYHAEIVFFEGQFLLLDQASRAGTLVNDVPVEQHALADGDVVHLGPVPVPQLTFRSTPAAAEEDGEPAASGEPMTTLYAEQTRFLDPERLALATAAGLEDGGITARIKALYEISSAMLEAGSPDQVAARLLDLVFGVLPADRGAVLLRLGKHAEPALSARRHRGTVAPEEPFLPSRTVTTRVLQDNVAVLSLDASVDDRFASGASVMMQSVRSVMCAPVASRTTVWGACYLDMVIAHRHFQEEELEFLLAASRQAGLALENLALLEEQKRTFESFIRTLAHSIDARDPITAGHSTRVARYAEAIARHLGLPAAERRRVWYAALLHDYGKIGTREAVLCKPGKLTPEEVTHIQEHAGHTFRILSKINFTSDMADLPQVASAHHERLDGKGYPRGLHAEQIPLGARVIAVADVFDALTAKRHYREPMPLQEVLAMLEQGRGTQFDGAVLDAFLRYVHKEYAPLQDRTQGRGDRRPEGATHVGLPPRRT